MITSKFLTLSLLLAALGNYAAPQSKAPPTDKQTPVSLSRSNDGQHVKAKIGQPIVIRLQTIGNGEYGTPQISSRAVRLEDSKFAPPQELNPGGPLQFYQFTAVAEGEAQIRIPHARPNLAVMFTIQVTKP